ncbi:hypothetical protein B0H67DRAFT_554099 [Lasiosphaeris hirsuta]|uniref:Uncharacterized protein n=1 Tax=Lasiosphaeris hirsuta TaxID=260670 RepID=A0AA40AGV0_9PEZI|nr:hypothetical protein B0H67DRAFT_554099 [Lasiosphaeris hirsuta]
MLSGLDNASTLGGGKVPAPSIPLGLDHLDRPKFSRTAQAIGLCVLDSLIRASWSAQGDRLDVNRVLAADPAIHNLKACGSCKIVQLPETTPCWGETAVVWASGCQTMGCLCDKNYREKRTKWIMDEVEYLCGKTDAITPQLTVDWFNTFCDAQLVLLEASAPATSVRSSGATGTAAAPAPGDTSGSGGGGSNQPGNTGTIINQCIDTNSSECTINNGPVNPSASPQTGGSTQSSDSDRLAIGLTLGVGLPSLVVGVLSFCAAMKSRRTGDNFLYTMTDMVCACHRQARPRPVPSHHGMVDMERGVWNRDPMGLQRPVVYELRA